MIKNYKNTLNLPKTLFPMKGNLIIKELEILKIWKKQNIYKLIRDKKKGKNIFLLHDGPIYANGNIHIGHAANKIIKDIILKSKTLSGMDTPYIVGWDCHGLPIESKIENLKHNIKSNNFISNCRKYALNQIKKQKKDFIRLGLFADWNNSYLTMNNKTEANTIRVLGKLIKLGYLKNRTKPIYWCINCRSSLSESEINYKNIESISLYVKFYIKNFIDIKKIFNININSNNKKYYFIIWTTTPWTLIDNEAIAINPNILYNLIEIEYEYFIISHELINKFIKKCNINKYKNINNILGKYILNIFCISPINFNIIPVIFDKNIDFNIGTGIVHIAPGHNQLDYEIGLKFNLKIKNSINEKGIYIKNIHILLNNTCIFESLNKIIEILNKNKFLFSIEKYIHKYPYCYRHNVKIIFRVTNQWFIDLNKNNLREKALIEIKKVKWIPKWGKSHIEKMIKNRPDWCISRQRNWGVPITLLINKLTNKLHPDTLNLIEKIANLIEKNGIKIWCNLDLFELIGNSYKDYIKVNDILDVWFDSGATFISVIKNKYEFKNKEYADLYVEGSDQYRGWFMSSLLISIAINDKSPYKKILTHGFIVDKNGDKMSKSTGNVIKPKDLLNKFGCDIIRLWISSSDYKKNINISDNILIRTSDIYRKIRNTIRFLLSNLYDFNPKLDILNFKNMVEIDIWILNHTYNLQKKIIYYYNSYNFHYIIDNIMKYCSIDISSNYLEIIKDRQYTLRKNSFSRRSCQTAIYYILESLVRWISPILSFTSEEIWNYIPGDRSLSIFTEEWFTELKNINKYKLINKKLWNLIFNIKIEINKEIENLKFKKIIKNNLELHIYLYLKDNLLKKLELISKELNYIFITSNVTIDKYDKAPNNIKNNYNINGLKILINKINGIKCNRCWHFIENKTYEKENEYFICKRCINNINGFDEIRKFA